MRSFAFTGNGPVTNRGCQAIVFGTKALLDQAFGPCQVLAATFGRDDPGQLPAGVEPLPLLNQVRRFSPFWWKRQALRLMGRPPQPDTSFLRPLVARAQGLEAAFSVGGDNYGMEKGRGMVDLLVAMDNLLRDAGVKTILWGASVGPFDQDPELERAMARHFGAMDLVVVREPLSRDYLRGLGVEANVVLAPDPAFVLAPQECPLPPEAEEMLSRPCIGLNLSPLLAHYAGVAPQAWLGHAAGLVEALVEAQELPVLLVPHVTMPPELSANDDQVFLAALRAALPDRARQRTLVLDVGGLNCAQVKWVISRTRAFAGARMHSTVAALSSHVPTASIAYSRKGLGINDYIFGGRSWVMDVRKGLAPERFAGTMARLVRDADKVRQELAPVIDQRIRETWALAEVLRERLD